MRILFISTWFPYPLDNGSRIRVRHLLEALAGRHVVHLVSFLPGPESNKGFGELAGLCADVRVVERDPFWRDSRGALAAHFSMTPWDVILGYSQEMVNLVRQVSQEVDFDLVIASTLEVAPYALQVAGVPRLLEEHNFVTRWLEEHYHNQRDPIHKAACWVSWQKCLHYERQTYPNFNAVTMVSERDRQAVVESIPNYQGRLEVIPNGVDLSTRFPGMAQVEADTLVFNGSLTYSLNADAMRFFTRDVWPSIRQARPGARLRITGACDGVDTSWLPDGIGIELTGYLVDVRPVVAGSWLAVAPLLAGSGTRLKILEAMALGTPVVATRKGAEGLDVTAESDILIADDPADLASACLKLMESPQLREELSRNGRRQVEAHYGWKAIGERFCDLAEKAAKSSGEVVP